MSIDLKTAQGYASMLRAYLTRAEPDAKAEVTRVVGQAVALANLMKEGYATPTQEGRELLRETVSEVCHLDAYGVWCGGVWGCVGCGRERTVVEVPGSQPRGRWSGSPSRDDFRSDGSIITLSLRGLGEDYVRACQEPPS